jgi:hypothetical protein
MLKVHLVPRRDRDRLEAGEFKSVRQAASAERSAHYGVTDSAAMSI